jgi:hypothetical protein
MRYSQLESNPELFNLFVEMVSDGVTRQKISDTMHINKETVTEWNKRPDIQAAVAKRIRDRANRVLRHTDTRIEKVLEQRGKELSVDQLLKIRHEFAGDQLNLSVSGDGAQALQELLAKADDDPALAAALAGALPTRESD